MSGRFTNMVPAMLELLAIGLGTIWLVGLVLAISLCRAASAACATEQPARRRARPIAG
jgi:hypothetical protein